ncbi:hypothetical protein EZV73_13150 [Acidaminobacter sp. JC074]|uniref:NPCBM/NEW2 domain-containing protein n=1 Tax=Acidaminobacter sp. JC074 TaxID=2530199 RepID=UPI001F0E8476|nr:NPCBM/NEW2 domain-containing protein [Acidaminobacter sp. JC074]MCH4888533.1 hypothetical protein [Acidaminobacter sp. JC074]
MKNKRIKVIAILVVMVFATNFVFAESGLTAVISDIKLFLNGDRVDKEIVIIDGSSYLPVKAISEALELEVNWNNELRAIELSSEGENSGDPLASEMLDLMTENNKKLEAENDDLKDLLKKHSIKIPTTDKDAIFVSDEYNVPEDSPIAVLKGSSSLVEIVTTPVEDIIGNEYTSGIKMTCVSNGNYVTSGQITYVLQGQYDTFKANLAVRHSKYDTNFKIYADDVEVYSKEINSKTLAEDIAVDVKGATFVKLVVSGSGAASSGLILEDARFEN